MLWIVSGADKETGEDKVLEIEADDEASATRRATRRGLMVADVRPAAVAADDDFAIESDEQADEYPADEAGDDPLAGEDFNMPPAAATAGPATAYAQPPATATYAAPFTAAATALAYQSAQPRGASRPIPKYTGLTIAASILRIYALLLYAITVLVLLVTSIAAIKMMSAGASPLEMVLGAGTTFAPAIALVFAAAMAHGASAGLIALRDIAQNSFR